MVAELVPDRSGGLIVYQRKQEGVPPMARGDAVLRNDDESASLLDDHGGAGGSPVSAAVSPPPLPASPGLRR